MGVSLFQSPSKYEVIRIDGFSCLLMLEFPRLTPLEELTGVVVECYEKMKERVVSFYYELDSMTIDIQKGLIRIEINGLTPHMEMTLNVGVERMVDE